MKILNDYLTPEEYPHSAELIVELEIYKISDTPIFVDKNVHYYMALRGKCTSANFNIDSTSDMRTSGSFELILDNTNTDFIDNSSGFIWYDKIIKVTKYYKYNNDLGFYDTYNWGDRTSLVKYTFNGTIKSDPSRCIVGWFVPNQLSYSYNVSEMKLSLSCTDMMAYFNSEMGGCLNEWFTNKLNFTAFNTDDYLYNGGTGCEQTIQTAKTMRTQMVNKTSGVILTGTLNQNEVSSQYDNIFNAGIKDNNKKYSPMWQDKYEEYKHNKTSLTLADYNFNLTTRENVNSAFNVLMDFTKYYLLSTPVSQIFINLENQDIPLPYDLEFSGDATLYDVYKKVVDLYPRQEMFIDINKTLNLIQRPVNFNNGGLVVLGKEISALVISESRSLNLNGIKNVAVVYGKDNTYSGMFARRMFKQRCKYCGTYVDTLNNSAPCATCGKVDYFIDMKNDALATENIGERLLVEYDDTCISDLECDNKAKHLVDQYCRLGESLSITLVDRGFSFYSFIDNGVGGRIEYTSKITGETNVYNLVKWTNSVSNDESTISLELEPFCPVYEDEYKLKTPTYTYYIDENGLMTMNINNSTDSKVSLFKVYISSNDADIFAINNVYYYICNFAGETCNEIDDITGTKQFKYQFKNNGKYYIYVTAYNPNVAPSNQSIVSKVTVDMITSRLKSYNGDYIKTEDDDYLLYS